MGDHTWRIDLIVATHRQHTVVRASLQLRIFDSYRNLRLLLDVWVREYQFTVSGVLFCEFTHLLIGHYAVLTMVNLVAGHSCLRVAGGYL